MTIETELRTLLTGNAGVAALVGTRVYPVVLPQNPTLPAIVYQELRTQTVVVAAGDTDWRQGRWLLSLWATTYAGTKAARDAVMAAVNGYAGGSIDRIEVDAARDDLDGETLWYRQMMELVIFWKD